MKKLLCLVTLLLTSCAGPTTSSSQSAAMLYLPEARGGMPGTTVPYGIGPDPRGRSVAAFVLDRATSATERLRNAGKAVRQLDYGSKRDGRCALQHCPSEPERSEVRPRTAILASTPEAVIGVALSLLEEGSPVSESSIRARLSTASQSAPTGVVTSIVSQLYPCAYNWDGVPKDLIFSVCKDGAIVEKISIAGQPAVMSQGNLSRLGFDSDIELWYDDRHLVEDVRKFGLSTMDVSSQYDSAWPGHMPSMRSEIRINLSCACLVIAETGDGRHRDMSRKDVISVYVYQRVK